MRKQKKISLIIAGEARALLALASRPQIFFFVLLWLMALLIIGTISEKYIGLYAAQKLFFSSFVVWLGGFVPVPGGYTILTIIFINLLAKLLSERWTKKKIGTLIIHCAALLLLLGGGLTATFSSEGGMVISEGAHSNFISDYHLHELVLLNIAPSDAEKIPVIFSDQRLKSNATLISPALPFKIQIKKYFENSTVLQRKEMLTDGSVHGMLVANEMRGLPLAAEDENNHAGIIFHVYDGGALDGDYGLFADMPINQYLPMGDKKYLVVLRGQHTELPFEVSLIKFTKQNYPGTNKAREYQSEVILKDGNLEWHSLISMNSPLRYKGYTFYQSSFIENQTGQATVLAVVKNVGAIFPYITSIAMCLGLLLHLIQRLPQLRPKVRD